MNTEKILALGNIWEKEGKKRIYISIEKLEEIFGLKYTKYNSGSVSGAELNGSSISNKKATDLIFNIKFSKTYYDFSDNQIHSNMNELKTAIENYINN